MLSRLNHRIKKQKRANKELNTTCAKVTKKIYKYTKFLKWIAILELLVSPYVTKPNWCIEKFKGTPDYEFCGFNIQVIDDKLPEYGTDEEYTVLGYPSSRITKLEPETEAVLDSISFLILLFFTLIRLFLKRATKTAIIRSGVISLTLLVLVIENMFTVFRGYPRHTLHAVLSFLILIVFIRSLRDSWKRIILVVADSLAIMIIILSYITFFALLGFTLFSNELYNDPAEYFEDIPSTIFNVYVMFTTSNFPDILFPFWKVNNSSAVLMVAFLMIGLYMLLNFMLAVFYNSYKQ